MMGSLKCTLSLPLRWARSLGSRQRWAILRAGRVSWTGSGSRCQGDRGFHRKRNPQLEGNGSGWVSQTKSELLHQSSADISDWRVMTPGSSASWLIPDRCGALAHIYISNTSPKATTAHTSAQKSRKCHLWHSGAKSAGKREVFWVSICVENK